MKKYLLLMMMAVGVLASCSKDEETSNLTAKDIEGTWAFQNPTLTEVVLKGSNAEVVKAMKEEYFGNLDKDPIISAVITFKSDMTCSGIEKKEDESIENFEGSYSVSNGRISAKLTSIEHSDHSQIIFARLEKRGADFYLIYDKQSIIDNYNSILKDPNLDLDDREMFKNLLSNFTASISEIYCPVKMIKK